MYGHRSYLVSKGLDHAHTAISRPVGLPAATGATGAIQSRGVILPLTPEVYEPILTELEGLGIGYTEEEGRVCEER